MINPIAKIRTRRNSKKSQREQQIRVETINYLSSQGLLKSHVS